MSAPRSDTSFSIIGWDIGGAHLKAAFIQDHQLIAVQQLACPLWQDLSYLQSALDDVLRYWPQPTRHVITMTGELADLFSDRASGVNSLIEVMAKRCGTVPLYVFAGRRGLIGAEAGNQHINDIASANWLATVYYAARQLAQGVLIDIGSTTTDIIPFQQHTVLSSSISDADRLQSDELVYSGVVRTPVCALAARAPFQGQWQNLMAEVFATTADVYRLLEVLPENADQLPSADGRGKSIEESEARLARMLGRDASDASGTQWRQFAQYIARRQSAKIQDALERVLSNYSLAADAPLVGAGVGRFLVKHLATQRQQPYLDFSELCRCEALLADKAADCAPAVALALLAAHEPTLDC